MNAARTRISAFVGDEWVYITRERQQVRVDDKTNRSENTNDEQSSTDRWAHYLQHGHILACCLLFHVRIYDRGLLMVTPMTHREGTHLRDMMTAFGWVVKVWGTFTYCMLITDLYVKRALSGTCWEWEKRILRSTWFRLMYWGFEKHLGRRCIQFDLQLAVYPLNYGHEDERMITDLWRYAVVDEEVVTICSR